MVQKEDTLTRLQRSILSKLETDESNVLTWLNATVKVPVKEKFVMSIGIKASALEGFAQVSVKEVSNWLREATDCTKSISLSFADSKSCTLDDLKKRNKKCKSYRGWKVPISLLNADVLSKLQERCGSSLALREEQASCSTEGAAPEEQMKPGKLDEFQWKLNSMDLYLLKYCEDYREQPRPETTEERNNFATNLTPESKKVFNNFSPRSRSVFKQGFKVAKQLHEKQAVSGPSHASTSTCSQDNQVHLQTPGNVNATTDSAGTQKRLFPAGTIQAFYLDMQRVLSKMKTFVQNATKPVLIRRRLGLECG